MSAAAGLDGLNTYSGLGFNSFADAMCMRFDGAQCADAWNRLWQPETDDGDTLAEVLGLDTVVVQRSLLDTTTSTPPPDWELTEVTDHVAVWTRTSADRWPGSRLTAASTPLFVAETGPDGPPSNRSRSSGSNLASQR